MTSGRGLRTQRELDDRYVVRSGEVLMSGIQALVRVTLDQRRLDEERSLRTSAYVSGYEGSPLGGLDLEMTRAQRHLNELGIVFRPGLNEEIAATAVAGTQSLGLFPGRRFDGVTGFWYGKNPGLDRAADAIRHGNLSGTAPLGGAVAWIGDDPASKSSTVPSSCIPMCRNLMMPVLVPGTVEEVLTTGLHAVAMSRHSGTWSGVQIVTDVADSANTVDVGRAMSQARSVEFAPRTVFRPVILLPPDNLDAEQDLMERRLQRASEYARSAHLNDITFEPERARFALVGVGLGYQAIVRALEEMGIDAGQCQRLGIRLVRLTMPWPLDPAEIRRLCTGVETVLVVEDKLEFVETLVRDALYRTPSSPIVIGKRAADGSPLLPPRSFVNADDVARALGLIIRPDQLGEAAVTRLDQLSHPRTPRSLPMAGTRTPFFCSGCPHNVSTRAPDDQLVGLGIGCHSLANMDPAARRGQLTGITQMGGEGAQWLGIAPFTDDPHFVQNLGDGTFHHSGSLAVRAAVAAGVTMTYKILYNNAVAMTGGQQPQGQLDVPSMCRLLEAEGVRQIVITTPETSTYRDVSLPSLATVRHRDELQEAQRELALVDGVTVLIHDDRCAAEKRRLRKRGRLEMPTERIVINERVCEGCGDCGAQSSCMSLVPIETEFGRKTHVHQSSCNFDRSCLKGNCPSFVLVTPGPAAPKTRVAPPPPSTFPAPVRRVPDSAVIRMPGVGGTGVVTVSAILQMAAYLDGLYAAGLDQIGLAQKGGPVVSDVRVSVEPIEGQLRASRQSVDVILGLDVLGATSPDTLSVANPLRTVAVLNSAVALTAEVMSGVRAGASVGQRGSSELDAVTRRKENVILDAGGLAESLFGDHFAANMILLGAAFQHGCLPVTPESIERAIELNGASAATNTQAFRWGRAFIAEPAAISRALVSEPTPITASPDALDMVRRRGLPGPIDELVALRYFELTDYQDGPYAERFLDDVVTVFEDERSVNPTGTYELTKAFARGLFKLMAYKDEYEVARLHLRARAQYQDEFGREARIKVLLHPPTLKTLGLKRKIALGRSAFILFEVLRRGRRLRGTKFDPFGHAAMRKVERELIREYRDLVVEASSALTLESMPTAVSLAELPDCIRGYDEVKSKNIELFYHRRDELLAQQRVPEHHQN